MLDFADFVAINKFDRRGAEDALRDVRKQVQRNREAFGRAPEDMPVYGTIASRFNDDGVTALYHAVAERWRRRASTARAGQAAAAAAQGLQQHRPRSSRRSACATSPRSPSPCAATTGTRGSRRALARARATAEPRLPRKARCSTRSGEAIAPRPRRPHRRAQSAALDARSRELLETWPDDRRRRTRATSTSVSVRGREIATRARLRIALRHPGAEGRAAALRGRRRDPALAACARTCPGSFPFTAGVFAFKRENEDPHAHVRRRRRPVPHQPALSPAVAGPAGEAAVHGVRLGDALRLRSRRAPGHLRQGRQFRRLDRHARRHEGALRRLRPVRSRRPRSR